MAIARTIRGKNLSEEDGISMKIATLGLAAAVCAGFAGTALAGANAGGYLLMHTDDTVIYSSDDEANYVSLLDSECPFNPNCTGEPADVETCVAFLDESIDVTSGRDGTQGEVTMLWVIAAFPGDVCPRVKGVEFGLKWELAAQPQFVAFGGAGDFELNSGSDWPVFLGSGAAVTWSQTVTRQAFPVYWLAAYEYYMPTTISIALSPFAGGTDFADDSIPSQLDVVPSANWGSVGLNGAVGTNPYMRVIPTVESSWGEVKAIFGR